MNKVLVAILLSVVVVVAFKYATDNAYNEGIKKGEENEKSRIRARDYEMHNTGKCAGC